MSEPSDILRPAEADAGPGKHESRRHPDTPKTMQRDDDSASRRGYADARPGDYSPDFQEDGSGCHPIKPTDGDKAVEPGIPAAAETRHPEERRGSGSAVDASADGTGEDSGDRRDTDR